MKNLFEKKRIGGTIQTQRSIAIWCLILSVLFWFLWAKVTEKKANYQRLWIENSKLQAAHSKLEKRVSELEKGCK